MDIGKMRYKLIKEFPGSAEVGTICEEDDTFYSCSTYPEFWEKVEEPKFKVGDWVKVIPSESNFRNFENALRDEYVFRVYSSKFDGEDFRQWQNGGYGYCVDKSNKYSVNYLTSNLRLATNKEVEDTLIAEAKRRGFKTGIIINRDTLLEALGDQSIRSERIIQISNKCEFKYKANYNGCFLCLNDLLIYWEGIWAEIVEEEPITINGYKAEFKDDVIKFGCRQYSKNQVFNLLDSMSIFHISSLNIDTGITVSIETIKKIYERMK